MLSILLIWFYISVLTVIFGLGTIQLTASSSRSLDRRLGLIPVVGLCVLTIVTSILHFFCSISLLANVIVCVVAIIIGLRFRTNLGDYFRSVARKALTLRIATRIVMGVILVFYLILTGYTTVNFDTGLYHAPAIRWIEEYPIVIGLGNLHSRLAFNTAWFDINALFSLSFLHRGSFHVLNGWLLLVTTLLLMTGFESLLRGRVTFSAVIQALTAMVGVIVLAMQASSPTPDVPAAALTWIVISLVADRSDWTDDIEPLAVTLLTATAIVIKLSAAPLLLIPIALVYRQITHKRRKSALVFVAIFAVAVVPYLIRNVLVSGYLIYPLAQCDLFHVPWKIPHDVAVQDQRWIQSWARMPNTPPDQVLGHGTMHWLPTWYRNLLPEDLMILRAMAIGSVLFAAMLTVERGRRIVRENAAAYGVTFLGILYWWLSAPDFRFGYGFIAMGLSMLWAPVILVASASRASKLGPIAAAVLILLIVRPLTHVFRHPQIHPGWLISPPPYPSTDLTKFDNGHVTVFVPTHGEQCWYAPLPNEPSPDPRVRLRGGGLASGFYLDNSPAAK